jgi:hypothetical protein
VTSRGDARIAGGSAVNCKVPIKRERQREEDKDVYFSVFPSALQAIPIVIVFHLGSEKELLRWISILLFREGQENTASSCSQPSSFTVYSTIPKLMLSLLE